MIDSSDYNYKPDLFTDSFGNSYDGRHHFNTYHGGYAVFNLEGKYSNFSGTIVANQNTGSNVSMDVAVYVDDKLVYTKTGYNKRTGAVMFNVDVSGVTKLEIKVHSTSGWENCHLSIVNASLSR